MTGQFFNPFFQAEDSVGHSIAGATLTFFENLTTTPKNTYSDSDLTTPNANPVVAIGTGRFPPIFLESGEYTVILKDADGVTLDTMDEYSGTFKQIPPFDTLTGNALKYVRLNAAEDLMEFRTAAESRGDLAVPGLATINTFTKLQTLTKGADIASAATLVLGTDGNSFDITGTTGITGITVKAGTWFQFQFDGAVPLTHSETLFLNNAGGNYTTAAGDILQGYAFADDSVRAIITKADGTALASGVVAGWQFVSGATAANDATIEFTGFETGHDYLLIGEQVLPATDSVEMEIHLGITGPTYRTSGYNGMGRQITSAGASAGSSDTAKIPLLTDGQNVGNAAGEDGRFEVLLIDPAAASKTNYLERATVHGTTTFFLDGGGGGNYGTAEAHTAIRFKYSAGNVSVGEFYLYKRPNV